MRSRDDEAGSSMIEVIVAFVILSLALTTIYPSIGTFGSASAKLELRRHAAAFAVSKMAAIPDPSRAPPVQRGVDRRKRYSWNLTIGKLSTDRKIRAGKSRPYKLRFTANTSAGAVLLDVETIRIGVPADD